MYNTLIYYGCGLILTFSIPCSSVYLVGRRKDKDWTNTIWSKCTKICPHGYSTDVEGNSICKCYDPCTNVFCLGGTTCVVVETEPCDWGSCKPRAECTDHKVNGKKDSDRFKTSIFNIPQRDDATSSRPNDDLCRLPAPTEAQMDCRRKKRKWFFEVTTGRCIRYKGCDTVGNSFSRKKDCKRTCKRSRRRKTRKWRVHKGFKTS
ncbi:hypothetical protein ScPMuIL_014450 [Solemya velum]